VLHGDFSETVDTYLTPMPKDQLRYEFRVWANTLEQLKAKLDHLATPDQSVGSDELYLLNYQKIREVIDSITSKAILILGRFMPPRKQVLDTIRDALHRHNYLPILFYFDSPSSRDLTVYIASLRERLRGDRPLTLPHKSTVQSREVQGKGRATFAGA
jgi:hypothetical protein